jgi:hypothetical protein
MDLNDGFCCCGKGEEEHWEFAFLSAPNDHLGIYPLPPEWLPNVDGAHDIRIDEKPARVAYQFDDMEPVVQVFEGDSAGLYTPCMYTTKDGINYWLCVVRGPKNPCGDSFMREISS